MTTPELLGLAEVAELYSISKNSANAWTRRHDFPAPIAQLKMGPVWSKLQVIAWRNPVGEHEQKHPIHCAWCGSNGLFDILNDTSPPGEGFDYGLRILCADCGKRSQVYFTQREVFDMTSMSLSVTKEDA